MDAETLRRYLEFYQDLGIKTLYRQPAPASGNRAAHREERSGRPRTSAARSRKATPCSSILDDIGDCRRCRLHEGRNKIVFGVGNEQSPLVFVGEGPGADEDAQGIPFVGRAGQLLTQMIEGTAKKEGIPLSRERRLHLQRGEVPSAGESHARAGRDGNLRPVSLPAALGDSAQSDLRARWNRRPGADRTQGRRHQDARQVVSSGATSP